MLVGLEVAEGGRGMGVVLDPDFSPDSGVGLGGGGALPYLVIIFLFFSALPASWRNDLGEITKLWHHQ